MGVNGVCESASGAGAGVLPIIGYHFLDPRDRAYTFGDDQLRYVLHASSFQNHLKGLTSVGYQTIGLRDYVTGRELPSRPVGLTFDDGHISFPEVAVGLLNEYGHRATLFIPTDFLGRPGYLARRQIEELSRSGVEIGSHGCSHRALTAMPVREMKDELQHSRAILEDIIGSEVSVLALPHGFGSRAVEAAAHEVGYKAICTSRFGLNDTRRKDFCLDRIGIKNSTSWNELQALMRPGSLPFARAAIVDRLKGVGKWVLQTHRRCE